jgi:hypothetical protein
MQATVTKPVEFAGILTVLTIGWLVGCRDTGNFPRLPIF